MSDSRNLLMPSPRDEVEKGVLSEETKAIRIHQNRIKTDVPPETEPDATILQKTEAESRADVVVREARDVQPLVERVVRNALVERVAREREYGLDVKVLECVDRAR